MAKYGVIKVQGIDYDSLHKHKPTVPVQKPFKERAFKLFFPLLLVAISIVSIYMLQEKELDASKFKTLSPGDKFIYGNYTIEKNGKARPIKWAVLRRENGGIVAISELALTSRYYTTKPDKLSWDEADLHSWLNTTFLHDAFSKQELVNLVPIHTNGSNMVISQNQNADKVSLLSRSEVEKMMNTSDKRLCKPSGMARVRGTRMEDYSPFKNTAYENCFRWWLRSGKSADGQLYYVDYNGTINKEAYSDTSCYGVRPVIVLNFEQKKK